MSNPLPSPINDLPKVLLPSILRTLVPLIYAALVNWGVVEWFGLPNTFWENVITGLITMAFYVVIRLLERHKAWFGWLLGYASQPVYVKGDVIATAQVEKADGTVVTLVQSDEHSSEDPLF